MTYVPVPAVVPAAKQEESTATILKFPIKRKDHARTSSGRAARRTSSSAVTPAARALSDDSTADHHSSGMRSRVSHLRAAGADAPISAASASAEGQRPMTSLNDFGAGIESDLGHYVLKCKANVSHDPTRVRADTVRMADRMSETEEKLAFIARTRRAREARFDTQKPMLTILGIDQGTYKQYETRTPLPHRYIPKFCAATGVDIEWLLTGEGKGPAQEAIPRAEPVRRGRKPRSRAA